MFHPDGQPFNREYNSDTLDELIKRLSSKLQFKRIILVCEPNRCRDVDWLLQKFSLDFDEKQNPEES